VYDFNTDQQRDNVRMPLVDDRRVQEFCNLGSERTAILNSVPGFGQVVLEGEKATRMIYIERRCAAIMLQLQQDYARKVGRNDPCPCNSGKKYKKCHGAA
jgi:preprotein translocase subunit SecA